MRRIGNNGAWKIFLRLSPVMRALLPLRLLEIDVVLTLAFFVVQARADLSAMLRFTIRIFQAPVSQLEVPPLCVHFLTASICNLMAGEVI